MQAAAESIGRRSFHLRFRYAKLLCTRSRRCVINGLKIRYRESIAIVSLRCLSMYLSPSRYLFVRCAIYRRLRKRDNFQADVIIINIITSIIARPVFLFHFWRRPMSPKFYVDDVENEAERRLCDKVGIDATSKTGFSRGENVQVLPVPM